MSVLDEVLIERLKKLFPPENLDILLSGYSITVFPCVPKGIMAPKDYRCCSDSLDIGVPDNVLEKHTKEALSYFPAFFARLIKDEHRSNRRLALWAPDPWPDIGGQFVCSPFRYGRVIKGWDAKIYCGLSVGILYE